MKQPKQNANEAFAKFEHVFVYGTLKRGQCREACWPREALCIEPAWTLGSLVDLGPYPALLVGNDRVLGELWSFHADDIVAVLETLDRVEGTNQPGTSNEYDRVRVGVTGQTRGELEASTYRYANLRLAAQFTPMAASQHIDGQSYVWWSMDSH